MSVSRSGYNRGTPPTDTRVAGGASEFRGLDSRDYRGAIWVERKIVAANDLL